MWARATFQQCADAVVRLRAEYLRAASAQDRISFRFTNGTPARWSAWRDGMRPLVRGNQVTWEKRAEADASYANFRRYLDAVFNYAGTASLARELERVPDPRRIQAGDLHLQPGFPGHAVLVVDVAEDAAGRRAALLVQSYLPAQGHRTAAQSGHARIPVVHHRRRRPLVTPEWRFPARVVAADQRFGSVGTAAAGWLVGRSRSARPRA